MQNGTEGVYTLDFQCRVENNKVIYVHFQKPMAKQTLIMSNSELSQKVIIPSLTQNLMRRMLNTSEMANIEERIKVVDQYCNQLLLSGYSIKQITDIVTAGLTGYEKLLLKCKKEKKPLHRSAEDGQTERRRKKLLASGNWCKQKKKGQKSSSYVKKKQINNNEEPETVTVMFVSQTVGGELARRLQREENKIAKMTKERIRIVERSGTTVKQILHKSNPWAGGHCGRTSCLMCENGDGKQNCMEKNIVYQISCLECAATAGGVNAPGQRRCRPAIYIGQTSRTGFERGKEQFDGLKKKNENNPLFKHVADKHNRNAEVKFRMTVVKRHFSAFSRLIHKALRIERMSKLDVEILNSRGEFQRNVLPRLVVENDKDDIEFGLGGEDRYRAGPEGGGGGQSQSESQSKIKTFTFQPDSCNAGESGGAKLKLSGTQTDNNKCIILKTDVPE